jgi:hypothetical protein
MRGFLKERKGRLLFVNKKKQKNVDWSGPEAVSAPVPQWSESFLLLFYKKEARASLPAFNSTDRCARP